jgi:hypothetical protein
MLPRVLANSSAFFFVLCLTSGSSCLGADTKAIAVEPDFTGKVIYVEMKDGEGRGMYMEGVKVKHLGGRTFLVGTYAKHPDIAEFPDVIYWVPIDQTRLMMEFKSMEDAKRAALSRKKVDR